MNFRILITMLISTHILASEQPAQPDKWVKLQTAIVQGNLDTIKQMVPSQIKPDEKNPNGLTPIVVAKQAKKLFDDVSAYVQSQIKQERAAVEGTWTSEHRAAANDLQNFVQHFFDNNVAAAKNDLSRATKHAENIINAAENIEARSPEHITLQQQFKDIEDIVGKQNTFAAEMKILDGLLLSRPASPVSPRESAATADELNQLREALDSGYLPTVKALIPSHIQAGDTLPGGQKITKVAFFHKQKHDQILSYLEAQVGTKKAKTMEESQPKSPRSKSASPRQE